MLHHRIFIHVNPGWQRYQENIDRAVYSTHYRQKLIAVRQYIRQATKLKKVSMLKKIRRSGRMLI